MKASGTILGYKPITPTEKYLDSKLEEKEVDLNTTPSKEEFMAIRRAGRQEFLLTYGRRWNNEYLGNFWEKKRGSNEYGSTMTLDQFVAGMQNPTKFQEQVYFVGKGKEVEIVVDGEEVKVTYYNKGKQEDMDDKTVEEVINLLIESIPEQH